MSIHRLRSIIRNKILTFLSRFHFNNDKFDNYRGAYKLRFLSRNIRWNPQENINMLLEKEV